MKYIVRCNGHDIARFPAEIDAQTYAARISLGFFKGGEVFLTRGKGAGIIGQYSDGIATPEFAHDDMCKAAQKTVKLEAPAPRASDTPQPKATVFLLHAEHFSVPGIIVKVYLDRAKAETEAVELVNIMLKDDEREEVATLETWEELLEGLQADHGAAHCYVEIDEQPIIS